MPSAPRVRDALITTIERKTIVFDIDETLVLAQTDPFPEHPDLQTTTIRLCKTLQNGQEEQMPVYLCFRPYILEMLIELYPDFELVLFTVGSLDYAQAFSKALHQYYWKSKFAKEDFFRSFAQTMTPHNLAQSLGSKSPSRMMVRPMESIMSGQGFFSHILSYKECLYSRENELYLKDLKILESNRSLTEIVIVDNSVKSFYLHMDNGIPIYDFEGDPTDKALFHLTVYLKSLLYEEDVRQKISIDFGIRARPTRVKSSKANLLFGVPP